MAVGDDADNVQPRSLEQQDVQPAVSRSESTSAWSSLFTWTTVAGNCLVNLQKNKQLAASTWLQHQL